MKVRLGIDLVRRLIECGGLWLVGYLVCPDADPLATIGSGFPYGWRGSAPRRGVECPVTARSPHRLRYVLRVGADLVDLEVARPIQIGLDQPALAIQAPVAVPDKPLRIHAALRP